MAQQHLAHFMVISHFASELLTLVAISQQTQPATV
jgi:hypothetical protein